VAGEAGGEVEPTAVAGEAGEPVDLEEPDKDPAIDDDPDEPYEPPAAAGGGERAVS
jgi:hypothetical protein